MSRDRRPKASTSKSSGNSNRSQTRGRPYKVEDDDLDIISISNPPIYVLSGSDKESNVPSTSSRKKLTSVKRKERHRQPVYSIYESDSDIEILSVSPSPTKKARTSINGGQSGNPIKIDLEDYHPAEPEDYDFIHEGYRILNNTTWTAPMSGSQRFLESDCYSDYNLGKLATLSLSDPVVKPLDDEPTFEMITTTLEQQFYSRPQVQVRRHTVWHDLHLAGPKPKHQPSKSMLWGYQAQYKEAPGSIMCIAHQNNLVVIGSATSGGQAEPEGHQRQGNRNTLPDPYNGDGNLMVLCKNRLCKVEGAHHTNQFKTLSKRPQAPIPQDQVKFYSVTGVKFDLQRAGRFVTTGCDGSIQLWTHVCNTNECKTVKQASWDSEWTPTDLEWHPDHSLCAVATKKSNVYLNAIQTDGSNSIIKNLAKLRTSASNNHESTGKIIFGYSASSGLLFTSTESENNITGCHKAFDVSTCRERWSLQECKGSSDAMSLAPKGDTLAVVTVSDQAHLLSLVDVKRSNKISASIRVRSFTGSQLFGEISDISFSPDGLILALGRNDDIIDIYDTRFLRHEKVLKRLSHHPDKKTANKELYGITGVRWLQPDSALASCGHYNLVTGGADGMVRLWDVSKSLGTPEDSMVLSSSEYDVASFSLGDTADHPLVVGDCGGAIYDYRYPRGRKAYPKF